MAGTVQFKKYNSGDAYRTVFYTVDSADLNNITGELTVQEDIALTQAKMHEGEPDVATNTVIRSYEIYIDDSWTDGKGETVSRLAKVRPDNVEDNDGYDVIVTPADNTKPILGDATETVYSTSGPTTKIGATNGMTITNISGNTAVLRVVLVCDV